MHTLNKIIMTLAGLLLIVGAGLKFYQMIDTCVPSWDVKAQAVTTAAQKAGEQIPEWKANVFGFWESYEFLLIQIPLEFALGVWMVSGLFRKAAWLAGTLAYFLFIFVTLTKWFTGAASCGCFGQIHVEPWKTLFFIDIPFFLLLAIFRPKGTKLFPPPWPNAGYMLVVAIPVLAVMALAAPVMVTLRDCIKVEKTQPDESAQLQLQIHKLKQELSEKQQEIDTLNKEVQSLQSLQKNMMPILEKYLSEKYPNTEQSPIDPNIVLKLNVIKETTSTPSVEPQTKNTGNESAIPEVDLSQKSSASKQWDWLQYVVEDDVRKQISEGLTVVLMYHHDCEVCAEKVPAYSKYYSEMIDQGNNDLKIAFLAIPPYGETGPVPEDTACILGKLTDKHKWQIMSPYVVALLDGQKVKEWPQGTAPEPEDLLSQIFGE